MTVYSIFWFFLFACQGSTTSSTKDYIQALHLLPTEPNKGALLCKKLTDKALSQDCLLAAIETLSSSAPEQARNLCPELHGKYQDECHFIIAEQSQLLSDCENSGQFVLDCKLHLLSKTLRKSKKSGQQLLSQVHLPADSIEGWTAIFRHHLHKQKRLDLTWCQQTPYPKQCRKAGLGLFLQRWDRVTLRAKGKCLRPPLPKTLHYIPDPELEKIANQRAKELLCPSF